MTPLEPQTTADFEDCFDLRWRVLRAPWNQPRGSERDNREHSSIHLMIRDESGSVIATGRVHFNSPEEAQVRYMAVEATQRGRGLGSQLLGALEHRAAAAGARLIVLEARESACSFYERHGYRIIAPGHVLFGSIPHHRMLKELSR